jgi:hypothetical protein
MNAKLAKFIKATNPKKRVSKLSIYSDEIQELVALQYTHHQITEYLSLSYDVEVSRQYLSAWLKENIKKSRVNKKEIPEETDKKKLGQTEAVAKMQKMFNKKDKSC